MNPTSPREINMNHGLLPIPKGTAIPSLTKVFGATAIADLPDADFFVGEPLEIKDQDINYPSDFCAAYAGTEVSEDQEGVPCVPEWTFAKAKQLILKKLYGDDLTKVPESEIMRIVQQFGLSLVDLAEAGIKYGFLERQYDHLKCDTSERPERDVVADFRSWPEDLDMLGYEHAKSSYFNVDGSFDLFDNIRSSLYKLASEKRTVLTGTMWRQSWSGLSDGMIPETVDPSDPSSPHAIKIFGWMRCKDGIRLVAQLSDGPTFGDHGLYYFPRSIVNSEFTFGALTFKDAISQEKAQFHSDLNLPIDSSLWLRIVKTFIYICQLIFKKQ